MLAQKHKFGHKAKNGKVIKMFVGNNLPSHVGGLMQN